MLAAVESLSAGALYHAYTRANCAIKADTHGQHDMLLAHTADKAGTMDAVIYTVCPAAFPICCASRKTNSMLNGWRESNTPPNPLKAVLPDAPKLNPLKVEAGAAVL